ncbi:MAG: hypothetical protein ACLTDV_12350 [Eubacterium sp.]
MLDATTGQNALVRGKRTGEVAAGLTGIVLTDQMDGTAKARVAVAIPF